MKRDHNDVFEGVTAESENGDGGFGDPRLAAVGVGNGIHSLRLLQDICLDGLQTVAVGADDRDTQTLTADTTVTVDTGVGGVPATAQSRVSAAVDDVQLVFVVPGALAGSTSDGETGSANGSGEIRGESSAACETIATALSAVDATTVAFVPSPTSPNSPGTRTESDQIATEDDQVTTEIDQVTTDADRTATGFDQLIADVDTAFWVDSNEMFPGSPADGHGDHPSVNQTVAETVARLHETITQPSLIGLDYADLRWILDHGNTGRLWVTEVANRRSERRGIAEGESGLPARDTVDDCFVHLTGGPELTLREAEETVDAVTESVDAENAIWTALVRESYADQLRVTCLLTDGRRTSNDGDVAVW